MREELLKGLSDEQIAKVKACNSQEELLKLAKDEGIELTDEQLEAVSGGFCTERCPNCHSDYLSNWKYDAPDQNGQIIWWIASRCKSCGHIFGEKPIS